jgi:hypothetical protein
LLHLPVDDTTNEISTQTFQRRNSRETRFFQTLLEPAGIRFNGFNEWDITILDTRLLPRVMSSGILGLGAAYMDGWWDCPRQPPVAGDVFEARYCWWLQRCALMGISRRSGSIFKCVVQLGLSFKRLWSALKMPRLSGFLRPPLGRGRVTDRDLCQ